MAKNLLCRRTYSDNIAQNGSRYHALPPDMMERHGRWLRMLISSALRGVMRLHERDEKRTFFFMDELAGFWPT
jgi:type IV secretory pathway TraG/TraD family ATPase VirD4